MIATLLGVVIAVPQTQYGLRDYFTTVLEIGVARSRKFVVSFDFEESYLDEANGSNFIVDHPTLGKIEFGHIKGISAAHREFLNKNNCNGVLGRKFLRSVETEFDVTTGTVTISRASQSTVEIKGAFNLEGYSLDMTSYGFGFQSLLSNANSSDSPKDNRGFLLEESGGMKLHYSDSSPDELRIFIEDREAKSFERGMLSFNRRKIMLNDRGLRFKEEGFMGPLASLFVMWLEKPNSLGSKVYPIMGALPEGLRAGDIVESIENIDLRNDAAESTIFRNLKKLVRKRFWKMVILRNGAVREKVIDRQELNFPSSYFADGKRRIVRGGTDQRS